MKVTVIVQLPGEGIVEPQLFVCWKLTVFAPVTVMLLTVIAEVPLLVTVMGFDAGTFTVSFPKARLVGLKVIGAATPVPVKGIVCVPALSVSVTEAERAPVPVGLKVTVMVQLPEAGMLEPQLLVC